MGAELSEVLHLRLRGASAPASPPDLTVFARRPSPAARRGSAIGIVPGGRRLDPTAPLLVFLQPVRFGIPAPSSEIVAADRTDWSLRPTADGYLVSVSRSAATGRARAAWVLAACIPLVLGAEPAAHASAPVQRPVRASAPPELPDAPPGEGTVADAPAEPAAVADPAAADPAVGTDDTAASVEPTQHGEEIAPGDAVLDAAWEGVDGFEVVLELAGGRTMYGRVGAVQRDTFTLIEAETGAVLVMPKRGVTSLRVRTPPALPTRTGIGALVSGGILTGTAAPVFIAGLTFVGICSSCTSLHLPMLLIGGGLLAGGIPLLVIGVKRRHNYRAILRERSLSPTVMRMPGGWTGGVRFRF